MSAVYCPKRGHRLAWREVDDEGQPVVAAMTVVATRVGMDVLERRFTADDFEDLGGLWITTSCACRDLFDVDLIAVRAGHKQKVRRVQPESESGVSYMRKRDRGGSIGD